MQVTDRELTLISRGHEDEQVRMIAAELLRRRQHHERPADVDFERAADMERLASLYTHDVALPSSTNGEVALGRCVAILARWYREQGDRLQLIVDSIKGI